MIVTGHVDLKLYELTFLPRGFNYIMTILVDGNKAANVQLLVNPHIPSFYDLPFYCGDCNNIIE